MAIKESKKTYKKKVKRVVKKRATKKRKVKSASKKTSKKLDKSKKVSKKTPSTMEELLETTGYKVRGLQRGMKITGVVTDISRRVMLIDIGAKTEGVVLDKEREVAEDLLKELNVGDKVETVVYSPENDSGQILLSLRQAATDYRWDKINEGHKTGEVVEVRGLEVNKGGLIARYRGVRGFIPASQFGQEYLGNLDRLQNRLIKVKIIEVDRKKNRLIFSEKAVSEAASIALKKKALKKVKTSGVYKGVVSGVMPFGVFVKVSVGKRGQEKEDKELFLEGLVHISEVSWEKVEDLNRLYKVGQEIEVKVISINTDTGKLNLSVKQMVEDPWKKIVKKYPKDKKVKGAVNRLVAFGAFVELELGVEGLMHISKIPADYDIKVGDKLDVYVETVDMEKRRMSLGLVLGKKPVGYK